MTQTPESPPSNADTLAAVEARHQTVDEVEQASIDADLRFEDADFTYDDAPDADDARAAERYATLRALVAAHPRKGPPTDEERAQVTELASLGRDLYGTLNDRARADAPKVI